MSHFAKLDENNVVIFVTVGRDEDNGKEAELSAKTGDVYKQTSYNTRGGIHVNGGTPFRKNYAGYGIGASHRQVSSFSNQDGLRLQQAGLRLNNGNDWRGQRTTRHP